MPVLLPLQIVAMDRTVGAGGDSAVDMADLPVVKMATMTGANYDDSDMVEADINKILAKKVGATLDITWSGWMYLILTPAG